MSASPIPFQVPLYSLALFYLQIAEQWELTDDQAASLAGAALDDIDALRVKNFGAITDDTRRRLGYLLAIYAALEHLLSDKRRRHRWIKAPNRHSLFEGATALDFMLGGDVERIALVKRYLCVERWGNVAW